MRRVDRPPRGRSELHLGEGEHAQDALAKIGMEDGEMNANGRLQTWMADTSKSPKMHQLDEVPASLIADLWGPSHMEPLTSRMFQEPARSIGPERDV